MSINWERIAPIVLYGYLTDRFVAPVIPHFILDGKRAASQVFWRGAKSECEQGIGWRRSFANALGLM